MLLGGALWLSLAQAGVTRHALIVGSNDGGSELPRLSYAEDDAERFREVLAELGGFAPAQITVLREPGRDELLSALRAHAWIAEQSPEDMFVFYYSGHADARGLRLGNETLPYAELRQGIRELPSEVRLGVLDACRSGEITRLKGLTLSEPFTSDDVLNVEGEAWLTAASADEDAQESDHLQGSFFTHYLVSGLRGAADQNDGMVSLGEAYDYAYSRTVARTGRTDAGVQHPEHDYNLSGTGNLALTDVRNASAGITLSESLSGVFTVLSYPDELPLVEIAKRPEVRTTVALPPGQYILRLSRDGTTREARFGLNEGSNHIVADQFDDITPEVAQLKGTPDVSEASAPLPFSVLRVQEALSTVGPRLEESGQRLQLRLAGTPMGQLLGLPLPTEDAAPPEGSQAVSSASPSLPVVMGGCLVVGPDCLTDVSGLAGASGEAQLVFETGALAATGLLKDGHPEGRWTFYTPEGARFAQGSYQHHRQEGTWTWWFEEGGVRLQGSLHRGQRSGVWIEFYDNGDKKSRIRYENGAPYGEQVEWYPNGRKESEGRMIGEQRFRQWTFYYPDGNKKARGSYDGQGRIGKWSTWTEEGRLSSQGSYWQDQRHGEWTFWWENGQRASRGSYNQGGKVGHWESWHPNGQKKSSGDYRDNIPHGRWSEWYEDGQVEVRGQYEAGQPVGRWTHYDLQGERSVVTHPTRRQVRRDPGPPPAAPAGETPSAGGGGVD